MNTSQIADALAQLQDQNQAEDVRSKAADLLATSGRPAVPALITALTHNDPYVREKAAEVLGQIGDASAVPALIETLMDNSEGVRVRGAGALGKIKDASAVPALIAALKGEAGAALPEAVEALGEIGDFDNPDWGSVCDSRPCYSLKAQE